MKLGDDGRERERERERENPHIVLKLQQDTRFDALSFWWCRMRSEAENGGHTLNGCMSALVQQQRIPTAPTSKSWVLTSDVTAAITRLFAARAAQQHAT